MTKPKFPGKPLVIDFEKIVPENKDMKVDEIFNELVPEPLNSVFDDIRSLLKLNFDNIASRLIEKPNKVFKMSSEIDTQNIREQVSDLNRTCFYECGRIFVYSSFLNEVVFGIDNWLFVENMEAKALSILFTNYEISNDELRSNFGFDCLESHEFLDSLVSILNYSENLDKFFEVESYVDKICIYPKENLINNLLDFKKMLVH